MSNLMPISNSANVMNHPSLHPSPSAHFARGDEPDPKRRRTPHFKIIENGRQADSKAEEKAAQEKSRKVKAAAAISAKKASILLQQERSMA
jgi:hypothetical protein